MSNVYKAGVRLLHISRNENTYRHLKNIHIANIQYCVNRPFRTERIINKIERYNEAFIKNIEFNGLNKKYVERGDAFNKWLMKHIIKD